MRFVGNISNDTYLSEIIADLWRQKHEVAEVLCSVAYVQSNVEFFKNFLLKGIPVTFWGRYDKGMPVHIDVLRLFHNNSSERFRCYLVKELFHPKVYWFKGYGCYIGSANIGTRAWQDNVEAGIFYSDDELEETGLGRELDSYFQFLRDEVNKSILSSDLMAQLEAQHQRTIEFDRRHSLEDGVNLIAKYEPRRQDALSAIERKRNAFLGEWNRTCGYVKELGRRLQSNELRPSWVPKDIPLATHADQFLHAFYYTRTKSKYARKFEYELFHQKNKGNVEGTVKEELEWWSQTKDQDFPYEKEFIERRAPRLKELLLQKSLAAMTEDGFVELCGLFHSFYNVARYCRPEVIGVTRGTTIEIRLPLIARRIFNSSAPNGKSFKEVLLYLFYGGPQEEVNHRLFNVIHLHKQWFIPHFGESCYGELVGWAFPESYVPRNDRTNKALRGLGYNVEVRNPNKEDEQSD